MGDFVRVYPIQIDTQNMVTEKVVKLQKRKALYDHIKYESVEIFESQFGCNYKRRQPFISKYGSVTQIDVLASSPTKDNTLTGTGDLIESKRFTNI